MNNEPQISTILYTTDIGKHTRPVIRHALAMARQYDAQIIMLHIVEPISETAKAIVTTYLDKEFTDEINKEAMVETLATMKKRLKNFYAEECGNEQISANVREVLVVEGKPSEEILRIAEEESADLIVMGKSTRKVRGIRVMGSTARRVSRMSKIPVLIVPNY